MTSRTQVPAVSHDAPRPVVKSDEASERAADRAAQAVVRGERVPSWSLAAQPVSVSRQPAEPQGGKPKTDEEKYAEAAKKTFEAVRETKPVKALEKKIMEHPTVKKVKDAATSPAGITTLVGAGVGGVSILAAAGKGLPFQPPEIPLDFVTKGLSGKVTYKGPVNRPTYVGLTLTYEEQLPERKTSGPTEKERFRAETARMAAEQERFRAGLRYLPGSKEAEERRLADQAIARYIISQSGPLGVPGLTLPILPERDEPTKEEEEEPVRRSAATTSHSEPGIAHVGDALRSPGRPLDDRTRRTMESRFGHDFSQVRLHDDSRAAASAADLQARAYTVGQHIVFGPGRPRDSSAEGAHLLAHELAHVVQQSRTRGTQFVSRYTAFSSAEQSAGTSGGWRHPTDEDLRISDDGQMAVEDKGWNEGTNKRAWTTPRLIERANAVLTTQHSRAKLRQKAGGQSIHGTAPVKAQTAHLVEIEPFKPDGSELDLASDCGTAAREVMGSRQSGDHGLLGGLIGGGLGLLAGAGAGIGLGFLSGGPIGAAIGGIISGVAGLVGGIFAGKSITEHPSQEERDVAVLSEVGADRERTLTPRWYHGGARTTPEEWSEELFRREFGAGLTRREAYARYAALTPEEKEAFARKYGVNQFARPRIGQGITISTEVDMPGFRYVGDPRDTWNFHYAAAVLASGDDYVTLENARYWHPKNWIWYMYGPARKGQSFHEEQLATGTHGTIATSFVVQPERLMDLTVRPSGATLTSGTRTVVLAGGTRLRVLERLGRGSALRYRVRVVDGAHAGKTGLVSVGDVR